MMIVSFSCVFRNLKRTYQASNLSDEFGKKRKYNDYRKEKRKSSLFPLPLFVSLFLTLFLSYTCHIHTCFILFPLDSRTLVLWIVC